MTPAAADLLDALAAALAEKVAARGAERLGTSSAPGTPAAMRFADFAEHVGCSRAAVFELARRGLPTVGKGRARRVLVAEALGWMRSQGAQPSAPTIDPELAAVAALAQMRARRRRVQ